MLLAVRISSYGCIWVCLESTQKARVALTNFSCSPNFPRASITRYTLAKHELILNLSMRTSVRNFATCRSRQSGKKVKKQKKKNKRKVFTDIVQSVKINNVP